MDNLWNYSVSISIQDQIECDCLRRDFRLSWPIYGSFHFISNRHINELVNQSGDDKQTLTQHLILLRCTLPYQKSKQLARDSWYDNIQFVSARNGPEWKWITPWDRFIGPLPHHSLITLRINLNFCVRSSSQNHWKLPECIRNAHFICIFLFCFLPSTHYIIHIHSVMWHTFSQWLVVSLYCSVCIDILIYIFCVSQKHQNHSPNSQNSKFSSSMKFRHVQNASFYECVCVSLFVRWLQCGKAQTRRLV